MKKIGAVAAAALELFEAMLDFGGALIAALFCLAFLGCLFACAAALVVIGFVWSLGVGWWMTALYVAALAAFATLSWLSRDGRPQRASNTTLTPELVSNDRSYSNDWRSYPDHSGYQSGGSSESW